MNFSDNLLKTVSSSLQSLQSSLSSLQSNSSSLDNILVFVLFILYCIFVFSHLYYFDVFGWKKLARRNRTKLLEYFSFTPFSSTVKEFFEGDDDVAEDDEEDGDVDLNSDTSKKIVCIDTNGDLSAISYPIPQKAVIAYAGDEQNIPKGYVICDGNNETPNLSGRFIVGSNSTSYKNNTKGAETTTDKAKDASQKHPGYYSLFYIMKI